MSFKKMLTTEEVNEIAENAGTKLDENEILTVDSIRVGYKDTSGIYENYSTLIDLPNIGTLKRKRSRILTFETTPSANDTIDFFVMDTDKYLKDMSDEEIVDLINENKTGGAPNFPVITMYEIGNYNTFRLSQNKSSIKGTFDGGAKIETKNGNLTLNNGELTTDATTGSLNDCITWSEEGSELKGNTKIHDALITESGSSLNLSANIVQVTDNEISIAADAYGMLDIETDGTYVLLNCGLGASGSAACVATIDKSNKVIYVHNLSGSSQTGVVINLLKIA